MEAAVPKFGDGVLGKRPVIEPGKIFQYMSMTHMETEHGWMKGSFLVQPIATSSSRGNDTTGSTVDVQNEEEAVGADTEADPFEIIVQDCKLDSKVCIK